MGYIFINAGILFVTYATNRQWFDSPTNLGIYALFTACAIGLGICDTINSLKKKVR